MKVALITTPTSVRSGIGDYTRHLLPYLRELCDLDVYVEPAGEEGTRPLSELDPRRYDQVLYQLGNELSHAFMPRMIRTIGGTVMQHDWVLFDLALAAWPGLARGGAKGHALALREGGLQQARLYARNWLDRRRQRTHPLDFEVDDEVEGTILTGWHDPEPCGRWTADNAFVRVPGEGVSHVEVEVDAAEGRIVRLLEGAKVLVENGSGVLKGDLEGDDQPVLAIQTQGIKVTQEQRAHGDARRLGAFVKRLTWQDRHGQHELDLSEPCSQPVRSVTLSRDRFELPFNRSIVRHADAFIVHSQYVKQKILAERNARTAVGIVHHGSEVRWRDEDRREMRRRFGLPEPWVDGFLVTSFGGVQRHKRIDKAMGALALARRERPGIHMALAGSLSADDFDPKATAARLGISDAVHFTGFVPEEEGWDWLHAGDIALNLRGPSSGGTSGGIFQAFSMGRAVIASDACEQRELPDQAVVKIPLGEGEVETLARRLVELHDDQARRDRLEDGVRRFVHDECHWGVVAKRYVEHMESFPRPKVTRRKLVAFKVSVAAS